MPLVRTADIVADARAARRGAGAFNVITLEHAEAIAAGAEAAGLPAILQISQNAVRFHAGRVEPIAASAAAVARAAAVPVALHLDHVTSTELYRRAADAGFSSVMFDGSTLPYAENVAATRAAATWAHRHGLWLEAELGEVGGKDGDRAGAHVPGARTDPRQAAEFVAATGVDILAVAVGSSHAMTTRTAVVDHALIGELRNAVAVPLVLHGSSGVPDDQLRSAVAAGIVKVNIGTALNISFTGEVRKFLRDDAAAVDPRRYLAPARDAMAAVVSHLLLVLADR